ARTLCRGWTRPYCSSRRSSRVCACSAQLEARRGRARRSPERRVMTKRHRLEHVFSYKQFDNCLREVDAVYIALSNSMHAEYTVRAAKAGVHVLCEKAMAVA